MHYARNEEEEFIHIGRGAAQGSYHVTSKSAILWDSSLLSSLLLLSHTSYIQIPHPSIPPI
jgi:hypothetical protein